MTTYDLDWEEFASNCRLKPQEAYQAIKRLESEGLIQLNEAFFQPAKLHIPTNHKELYAFQVAHASYDPLIKALLRLYGGELFTDFCNISENKVARFLQTMPQAVIKQLHSLHQLSIVQYIAPKDKPQLTFITSRYPASQIPLDTKKLKQRSDLATKKAEAVIHYTTHQNRCRAQLLLEYFDEISYKACGLCDICLAKAQMQKIQGQPYQHYRQLILQHLQEGACDVKSIVDSIDMQDEAAVLATIRQMLDNKELMYDQTGRLVQHT